jgi:23S rRNA (pseudouridine1915-N3)-methyltransferase
VKKINIIYVGGIKQSEKYYREALGEYTKRLSGEFKIEDIELKEELPQNPGRAEIEACLASEGKKILGRFSPGALKIALCPEGKKSTSEAFASLLYGERALRAKSVDFIIGSSHGLSGEVKKAADLLLSLSDMTFSHRLARVMLAEQIYRAYAIVTGRKYNK